MITPRILFVHAHPDDETIATGGTIAALAAEGDQVTVLTATRGEGGEVIPPEMKALEGDRAGLASVRESEIAEAMRSLGVTDHRFLGTRRGGA
ncbi:PIG-L family deacetylase [Brevibacterium casei]|nr:PIG-L family deacetylase [Brevibacterium casei]